MEKDLELFKMSNWNKTYSNYYYGVYLISPGPLSVIDERDNSQIGNGDIVNGCYLYAEKALLRLLG